MQPNLMLEYENLTKIIEILNEDEVIMGQFKAYSQQKFGSLNFKFVYSKR